MSGIKVSSSILMQVQDRFFSALEEKTSWGKLEVRKLYMEIKNQVLIEHIQKLESVEK